MMVTRQILNFPFGFNLLWFILSTFPVENVCVFLCDGRYVNVTTTDGNRVCVDERLSYFQHNPQ